MAIGKMIDRNGMTGGGAGFGVIPPEIVNEIIQDAPRASAVLGLGAQVRMSTKERVQPVLNTLPEAKWLSGDTDTKSTTAMEWGDEKLIAEEIACIVPIPDAVLYDSNIDVWSEVRPRLVESIGKKLDAAALFGGSGVATFKSIYEGVSASGVKGTNVIARGTNVDLAADVTSAGAVLAKQGLKMNGFLTEPGLEWELRGLRDANGQPIYTSTLAGSPESGLYGRPLREVDNGSWDSSKATMIAGDFSKLLVGIRQDVTYKISNEATIGGESLFEKDMTALRVVFRVGFKVVNPINSQQPDPAKRYPFVVIAPKPAGK